MRVSQFSLSVIIMFYKVGGNTKLADTELLFLGEIKD